MQKTTGSFLTKVPVVQEPIVAAAAVQAIHFVQRSILLCLALPRTNVTLFVCKAPAFFQPPSHGRYGQISSAKAVSFVREETYMPKSNAMK